MSRLKSAVTDAALELDLEHENRRLRSALIRAQRAGSRKLRDTASYVEAVHTAVSDAVLAHGPANPIPTPARTKSPHKPEVALLHLTDWQLGKKSESFGIATLRARIANAVTKTISLTEIQRSHHPVDEIHVMLGGDMVEGISIFPGQVFEVEANLFEQLIACSGLIESAIKTLLGAFSKVVVWEEIGNHGRLGKKGEFQHGDNVDRMAYTIARNNTIATAGVGKRLVWNAFAGGIGTHVKIGDYTALLVHGDEIKSFGGNTPAFGILRKVTSWATGVLDPFTDAYMGHFHTPMDLTYANGHQIYITGSPESDNGYAKEFMAATGKPSQRLHFVDPVKGRVTNRYTLWLD